MHNKPETATQPFPTIPTIPFPTAKPALPANVNIKITSFF